MRSFATTFANTEVSALTGISKSTLSRVESDQLSLTYDKLLQLLIPPTPSRALPARKR